MAFCFPCSLQLRSGFCSSLNIGTSRTGERQNDSSFQEQLVQEPQSLSCVLKGLDEASFQLTHLYGLDFEEQTGLCPLESLLHLWGVRAAKHAPQGSPTLSSLSISQDFMCFTPVLTTDIGQQASAVEVVVEGQRDTFR